MLPPIIIFLIVLSILIFIHEIGHFLAAKKAGIKVEEFGFGYPPRAWGKKIGETIYSINWIPFGGFVKLLGQEKREKKKWSAAEAKKAFFSQSKKAKVLVLLAGVFGNFVLGIICFSIIYSKLGIPTKVDYVKVVGVVENGPADNVGLQKDDQIIAVEDEKVDSLEEFVELIEENKGEEVSLITRDKEFLIVPRENPPENEGRLGIIISDVEMVFYPWWQMPFRGAIEGIKEAFGWSLMILQGIGTSIGQLFTGVVPEVAGPIGIFQLTTAAAKDGLLSLIQFVGILSINLAILNLLPFPALDGGYLFLLFAGDLFGEKRREKIEHVLNVGGFLILISLMILVTISDLSRVFRDSPAQEFVKNLLK